MEPVQISPAQPGGAPPTEQPATASLLYRLVASKLGTEPLEFIRQRRTEQKPPAPFRLIAQELAHESGVDVTYEAVRRWWRATPEGQQELADVEEESA